MRPLPLGLILILSGTSPATEVELHTFRYREPVIEIPVGGEVRWTNRDEVLHTVTSGTPERPDRMFQGTLERQGSGFAHRFERPGSYPYFCARHRFMRGEVRVVTHPNGAR